MELIAIMGLRTHSPGPATTESLYLSAIVLLGFVLRTLTVVSLDIPPESDSLAYFSMARNLLDGIGIVDSMGNRAMYNVGYPLFVITPLMALFGSNLLPVQIGNAVLGALSAFLCYAVAREAGIRPVGRLAAALIWALYVPSWIYAEYLAKENLMIPLMLGIVWCTLRSAMRPSVTVAAGCGMLFGLLALTGNAGLILVPVSVVALVIARCDFRRKLIAFGIALAIALAVVAPWVVRNEILLGAPILNTNGGFNLYLGNNPSATGHFVSISDTPRGPTWEALRKQGEVHASQTLGNEAVDWIRNNPLRFIQLALRKAVLFWTPPVHQGKGPGSTLETLMRFIWLIQFLLVVAAAIGSMFVQAGRTRHALILWLAIAGYTAVHMLFYVIYRYREPIMPLVCVLAAVCLDALWSLWGHRMVLRLKNAIS